MLHSAYLVEYSTVANKEQAFLRKRFVLMGLNATFTSALLAGFFAGLSTVNESTGNYLLEYLKLIPLFGILATIGSWLGDLMLNTGQRKMRDRGIRLEKLLGLEEGMFSVLLHWCIPNEIIREAPEIHSSRKIFIFVRDWLTGKSRTYRVRDLALMLGLCIWTMLLIATFIL
jgi:hypothetical protein